MRKQIARAATRLSPAVLFLFAAVMVGTARVLAAGEGHKAALDAHVLAEVDGHQLTKQEIDATIRLNFTIYASRPLIRQWLTI